MGFKGSCVQIAPLRQKSEQVPCRQAGNPVTPTFSTSRPQDRPKHMKNDEQKNQERRKHLRIKKNFILSYYLEGEPSVRYKVTQLKNISKGGMCFITGQKYDIGTKLIVELRTPYLVDITRLDGTVLDSHEKLSEIIYETRIRFASLTPQAEFLISKLEELFKKGIQGSHE